jgi:hypothetical protein
MPVDVIIVGQGAPRPSNENAAYSGPTQQKDLIE